MAARPASPAINDKYVDDDGKPWIFNTPGTWDTDWAALQIPGGPKHYERIVVASTHGAISAGWNVAASYDIDLPYAATWDISYKVTGWIQHSSALDVDMSTRLFIGGSVPTDGHCRIRLGSQSEETITAMVGSTRISAGPTTARLEASVAPQPASVALFGGSNGAWIQVQEI